MFNGVYLLVCLFVGFPQDKSKTDAARIIKLDKDTVLHESGKFIYYGVKRLKVKPGTRHKNIAGVGHGASVSAGFF